MPAWLKVIRVPPMTRAEIKAPIRIAYCAYFGVHPRRKPVFRDWAVVPPLEAATQTTAAIERASTLSRELVQPSARKIRQVSINVATVIPEMGFDDEPISPVSLEETVTNRNPNKTTSTAPEIALTVFTWLVRNKVSRAISPRHPPSTTNMDISFSVLDLVESVAPDFSEESPDPIDRKIMGSVRNILRIPAVATQPAPMNRR